jgi:SprT-like family
VSKGRDTSIPVDNALPQARRIFEEINHRYHEGRLPKYTLVEVTSLPDAPRGAVAQTAGPERTIRLRTNLWPRDEGGFSEEFVRAVLAHESIHARLFVDKNPNWMSCASKDFDVWRRRIPIAR